MLRDYRLSENFRAFGGKRDKGTSTYENSSSSEKLHKMFARRR